MSGSSLILHDEKGLFCRAGGFYIDPSRRVDVALITHAHSDHARKGSKLYYCAQPGVRLLQRRVGPEARIIGVPYREPFELGRAKVSFHPAGHILGSAQIRVEVDGEVWVVSGDYKREPDPTCEPFEVVPCDTFVTEATFGHPRYDWSQYLDPCLEIHNWWEANRKRGRNSLLFCYSLGKAQRILGELKAYSSNRVLVWGEAAELTAIYRDEGVELIATERLETIVQGRARLSGELVLAPHSFNYSPHLDHLDAAETAFASGWMQTGAFGMFARYDRGFVLSDHADFAALVRTVEETRARRVLVLHDREGTAFIRHLRKQGIEADPFVKPSRAKTVAASRKRDPRQPDLFR